MGLITPLVVFAAVFALFINGMYAASSSQKSEALRVAKDSITRAVISYYATEGSYPDSYETLKQEFGLKVSDTKYTVVYEIFASNIMPAITVIER